MRDSQNPAGFDGRHVATAPDVERIARLIRSQSTLTIATCNDDGSPANAPLFYLVDDDLRLYWFSSPTSEHSANLQKRPVAALTIYRSTGDWREICGVQLRGTVAFVGDPVWRDRIAGQYTERFHLPPALREVVARSSLFLFRASWARYIDNGIKPGYRFETPLVVPEIDAPDAG